MLRRRWLNVALAALALAGAGGWYWTGHRKPRLSKVILISIDTLRADHLGYAGYERDTSPNIDRLASQSLDFRQAYSQASATLPSHASMFTSLHPSVHGAEVFGKMPLADGFTTLAEHFRHHGYRTGAFVEGGQMAALWNLDQGFEVYDDPTQELDLSDWIPDQLEEILSRATLWIEQHRREPFFCFIQSYVVHAPYMPRAPYDRMFDEGYHGPLPFSISDELELINARPRRPEEPDVRHVISLYDGEIRYMDKLIGQFLNRLTELGLDDETVVVFTSDHGEEFAEHGRVGVHAHTLADELLHVPLLIRVPGMRARIIHRQVRLSDLAPTLLALMNIHSGGVPLQGRNLLAQGGAAGADLPVFSELERFQGLTASLRSRSSKIVLLPSGQFLLFDLEADPGEQQNCFDMNREEHRELVKDIRAIVTENEKTVSHLAFPVEVDPQTEEQLRALGYIE